MEFDGVELFAGAHELDGRAGDVLDVDGRAAAGIGVVLGEDDAIDLQLDGRSWRRSSSLTGHGVDDEEDVVGSEERD